MQMIRCDETKTSGFDTMILTKADLKYDLPAIKSWYVSDLKADSSKLLIASIYDTNLGAKPSVKTLDKYLAPLLEQISANGIKTVYVIEKDIVNRLSGKNVVNMRNVFKVDKCPDTRFICGVNYKTIDRTPSNEEVLYQSIIDLQLAMEGKIIDNNSNTLIEKLKIDIEKPSTIADIEDFLNRMLLEQSLGMDIEAYSLQTHLSSIGSIAMASNKQNVGAFSLDFKDSIAHKKASFGLLAEFFRQYKGQKIFYNSCYDVRILTYYLFMKHSQDWVGMRKGMDILYENCDDPLFMSFCLRNSVLKPDLKLKSLLYPYFGNYGIDVTDITLHTKEELLTYNAIDSVGMHYVFDDMMKELLEDKESLNYYQNHLLENRIVVTEAELVGLPIDLDKVKKLEKHLIKESSREEAAVRALPEVKIAENILAGMRYGKNYSNKKVIKTVKDYYEPINFGSPQQLNTLLYEVMNLPIVLYTEKNNPSSGNDALKMLEKMFSDDEKVSSTLGSLMTVFKYQKLLSSFIPAFYEYSSDKNGHQYVCGNLNLIGTFSGRMSSSKPNMTNMPVYQPVQECFVCEKDEVLFSADFSALNSSAFAMRIA